MAIGFALIVYNIYYSIRYSPRNISADPWDARTLEWATHTPVPEYNFAVKPQVAFRLKHSGMRRKKDMNYFQENIKRFICQIIVVLPFIYGCYLLCMGILVCICYMATADYQHNRYSLLVWHIRSFEKDHGRSYFC